MQLPIHFGNRLLLCYHSRMLGCSFLYPAVQTDQFSPDRMPR